MTRTTTLPAAALCASVVCLLSPSVVESSSRDAPCTTAGTCSEVTGQPALWSAPRRAGPLRLRALWRSDGLSSLPALPYPSDIQFAEQGLAVYDYGEKRIHVIDAASGRPRFAVGRRGPGPAEFGDRPVWFFGTWSRLMAVEFSDGRITALVPDKLQNVRVSREGRWATGCAWGSNEVLLQTSGHDVYDYFVSTTGETARIVDSIAAPWPRHRAQPFIVRQGPLRQADDSTCALLPLYEQEFALIAPNREARLGMHIEPLPEAKELLESNGRMRSSSLAKGARKGALDARAWRGFLIVLFQGTSNYRRRILDLYDRHTLSYQGSTLLPFEASRFAIRGDTLVMIGDDDDEPLLAAYLLSTTTDSAKPARR